MRSKWSWLSLPLIVLTSLALLVSPMPVGAQAKTDIVLGTQQEPAVLGLTICDACTMFVASMVETTLLLPDVTYNEKWEYFAVTMQKMPNLKDGTWKLLPNGKMQVTWKMKTGLTWQDGAPFNAYDYIFGWRVNQNQNFPSAGRDVSDRVENILAPDPYTLVVQWKKKYAFADLGVAGSVALPRHLVNRDYQANPAKLDQSPYFNSEKVLGNGPYRIVQWQKGSSITVEAWDKFRGDIAGGPFAAGTPIKRITFRFIGDTNTLIANVLSGAIDVFDETAVPFIQGLQLEKRLASENRTDWALRAEPGLVWEHVDINTENPKLSDKRVRQALLYAINRQQLVQTLFEGKQPVSDSWLPPKHYGYFKDIKKYAFDVARANALLDEAGWARGPDGIRTRGGVRLELTINTTAGNRTRESVEQILQASWRAIGVDLKIQNYPARVYFGDVLPNRRYELGMFAWVFGPNSDCEGIYTGDTIPGPGGTGEGQNYTGYKNAEVTKICHAVPEELDKSKRAASLRRMQEIWIEDMPVLPLYFRSDYTGHKVGVLNYKPTGASNPVTWNVSEWAWAK